MTKIPLAMDRRTFLAGLASVAAAPVLPALTHGEYAGEGLQRHILAWLAGEDIDPETGLPHLGHALGAVLRYGAEAYGRPNWSGRPLTTREVMADISLAAS